MHRCGLKSLEKKGRRRMKRKRKRRVQSARRAGQRWVRGSRWGWTTRSPGGVCSGAFLRDVFWSMSCAGGVYVSTEGS